MTVLEMLKKKDYFCSISHSVKYQFVVQDYLKRKEAEAEAYLKKRPVLFFRLYIRANDYDTIRGLLESGLALSYEQITELLDYAAEHTQKGGDMQIQALLADYRHRQYPSSNPFADLDVE